MRIALLDPAVVVVAAAAGVVAAALGVLWPYAILGTAATLAFRAGLDLLPRRPNAPAVAPPAPAPAPGPAPAAAVRRDAHSLELSAKELAVAQEIARGLTDKEIGGALDMRPGTVRTHIDFIKSKLGVDHRSSIVRWVVEHGYLPPEDDRPR